MAVTSIGIDEVIALRAQSLVTLGYSAYDALHVAAAESAGADVLLTTDDRLLTRTALKLGNSRIPVRNPLSLDRGVRTMTAIDQLTDEQFERHALNLLQRELGPDGLARFLRLNRSGTGDYSRDRENLRKDLTLDQTLKSIREHREQSPQ